MWTPTPCLVTLLSQFIVFHVYLSEPDSLSLNKSIDFWRFHSSCSSLVSRNSSSFLLLVLINHLLMVLTLKFYPVGAHYEIGGPLFSPQLLLTILQCGLLIRKQRETTLVLKCVTRSFVSILNKLFFRWWTTWEEWEWMGQMLV